MTPTTSPAAGLDVVILAAGLGSGLSGPTPKPLTPLGHGGETLLGRQLRLLAPLHEAGATFTLVLGHRPEEFRAAFPWARFVVNERCFETNTAKSLLAGLAAVDSESPRGALWLNGDVV